MDLASELARYLGPAQAYFEQKHLSLRGFHWYVPQVAQKTRKGLFLAFDAGTHDPRYFGEHYTNASRIKLLDVAYGFALAPQGFAGLFPGEHLCFDVNVELERPHRLALAHDRPTGKSFDRDFVDVTVDNGVVFRDLSEQIARGEIETGSSLALFCRKYHIGEVLTHGLHYISPDTVSVEMFGALTEIAPVTSVLEIGAGVGVCGVAARNSGIRDFTFVDLNPTVCAYLREHFGGDGFGVVRSDIMDFPFDRHWDMALVAVPYELIPWFLEKRGRDLACHCTTVVFQSGCSAFFEFEHAWLMGKPWMREWPWYRGEQSLRAHYPFVFESAYDWQYCVVGTHDKQIAEQFRTGNLKQHFSLPVYDSLVL